MTAEKFQTAMQGTCKSCMSSFCLFITAHIISVVSFQNTLSEQFLFKDRFQFNLPCEDVKHASIGVEGLISCKFALFKPQENEELISEPAISLWGGAKTRPEGLWSSGVSTKMLYRNRGLLSQEIIKPFRKAEFKLAIFKIRTLFLNIRQMVTTDRIVPSKDIYPLPHATFSQWDWVIVSTSSITALNPYKWKWPLPCIMLCVWQKAWVWSFCMQSSFAVCPK